MTMLIMVLKIANEFHKQMLTMCGTVNLKEQGAKYIKIIQLQLLHSCHTGNDVLLLNLGKGINQPLTAFVVPLSISTHEFLCEH